MSTAVLFSFIHKRTDYNKLIGFDISQGMLSQAILKNTHKNIEFIQANAENLPAKSESADALTISFGFRNVDNQEKALCEFYRVLKNNGTLILLDFFLFRFDVYWVIGVILVRRMSHFYFYGFYSLFFLHLFYQPYYFDTIRFFYFYFLFCPF